MINYERRLSKLEQSISPAQVEAIEGVFLRPLSPVGETWPVRFAECDGMRFVATDDESEDAFCERISAAIPKTAGMAWIAFMYRERPAHWTEQAMEGAK